MSLVVEHLNIRLNLILLIIVSGMESWFLRKRWTPLNRASGIGQAEVSGINIGEKPSVLLAASYIELLQTFTPGYAWEESGSRCGREFSREVRSLV